MADYVPQQYPVYAVLAADGELEDCGHSVLIALQYLDASRA